MDAMLRWHRLGHRWKSRHVGGRPRFDSDIRAPIRRMSRENPLWGAPWIHGELLMIGIEVAESTVYGPAPPTTIYHAAASLRWICSWCAPSPSTCSTAW